MNNGVYLVQVTSNAPNGDEIVVTKSLTISHGVLKMIADVEPVPNPVPRAIDFAAPSLVRRKLERDPRRRLVLAKANWFITDADTNAWGPNKVLVGSMGARPSSSGVWWALGAFALVGAGLYTYNRWGR